MEGKRIEYLRISVTDRCNLKCSYCRPDNMFKLPHDYFLRHEEIRDIVEVFSEYGLEKVRITGGEPLLRKGIENLVSMISEIPAIKDISMTTNGILLPKYGSALKGAGLNRVNISLDSLKDERFKRLTGGELKDVLKGIEYAKKVGFEPVKINVVLIKGFNEDEIIDFVEFGRYRGLHIRFIELMPVGFLDFFDYSKVFPLNKAKEIIEKRYGSLKPARVISSKASRDYIVESINTVVGFISPLSMPFCEGCKKLRLTSDGRLKFCLRTEEETDIKGIIRKHGKEGLRNKMNEILERKEISNKNIAEKEFIFMSYKNPMINIGG